MSTPEGILVKQYQVTGVDGTIYTFEVWLTKVKTGEEPPGDCPPGQHRDPMTGECVPNEPPPPPPTNLEEIPIVSATANRDDGNVASNVISPDVARWSCQGTDCELLLDLGHVNEVGQVFVTFFRGGERTERFEVGFSQDNVKYVFVSESQQDAANAIVKVSPLIKARYVKFLAKGSNVNDWNSVEYVKISGKKLPPPPPPEPCPPQTCPEGQHWDPVQCKCVPNEPPPPPPPPPPTGGAMDKNGIQYMFAVKGFESFDFNPNFRSDGRRFDFEDVIGQPGCEVGGYFKINNNASDEVSGKLYGGDHNDDNPEYAHTYDIGMNFEGNRVRLRIEDEHPDYTDTLESESLNLGRFNGRWVGFRFMCFNIDNNTKCRMVTLVDNKGLDSNDKPHNDWQIVGDWTDSGQYPHGPYIDYPFGEENAQQTIRVDEVGGEGELDWYGVFCRKIDPTKPLAAPFLEHEPPVEPPIPEPQPEPEEPEEPGTIGAYPYPAIGQPMKSSQRGPTTRHYRSGKDDDQTIEKNVKNIKFKNYQWVCYVTMHKIEHDDTLSVKFGGTHMGSGWLDHGISFKGQCCMGKEEDHPSTDLCVKKGPNLGSILEKKVGIAGVYFTDTNFSELWIDMGDGWKKQMEAKDLGGFNPGSDEDEAQLRIDGFKKGSVPTIHSAVVTQIAAPAQATAAAAISKKESKSKAKIKSKKVECGTGLD